MRLRIRFASVVTIGAALLSGAPPARAGTATAQIVPLVALPHHVVGIAATVAGHAGLFLFDTGMGVTVVTPSVAASTGCRPWGRITGFRAIGERGDMRRCDDLRLSVDGQGLGVPIAGILDLQRMMPADMPPLSGAIGLDLFAGRVITIRPQAGQLVLENAATAARRERGATEVAVRVVRDVEGVALTVVGAVPTPAGQAWMELDTGNTGPLMIGQHVARDLKLDPSRHDGQAAAFSLSGGIPVRGPAAIGDLIMDGDVGQSVLGQWDVTLDLARGRAWFRRATGP